MEEWLGNVATVATPLIAIAALIVSIWVSRRVARKREFEILLERIDREAAKREAQFEREAAKREALFEKAAAESNERFEREAERREAAIRMLMDRSDSRFDALLARSDKLFRQSADVTERVARNEGILDTVQAGRSQAPAKSTAANGESEAIAAQGVAGGRPSEDTL